MVDYLAMGLRLRKKRRERRLSQVDLANAVNISTSFYGNIERGIRIPSIDTLVAIANVLDVGLDYILGDSLIFPRHRLSDEDKRAVARFLQDQIEELDYGDGNSKP